MIETFFSVELNLFRKPCSCLPSVANLAMPSIFKPAGRQLVLELAKSAQC